MMLDQIRYGAKLFYLINHTFRTLKVRFVPKYFCTSETLGSTPKGKVGWVTLNTAIFQALVNTNAGIRSDFLYLLVCCNKSNKSISLTRYGLLYQ